MIAALCIAGLVPLTISRKIPSARAQNVLDVCGLGLIFAAVLVLLVQAGASS